MIERRRFMKWLGLGPLLATVGWRARPTKREHIPEDWSRWLVSPNFAHNLPQNPDIAIDLRFKAVGPNPTLSGSHSYRSGLRILKDTTLQQAADRFIEYGRLLHRFARAYDGGKRRTTISTEEFMGLRNDDVEPLPYIGEAE